MSITGERGFSQATKAVALLDAPVVAQADLVNSSHWINDTGTTGKRDGSVVYVKLTTGELTTAVAQGPKPTDGWAFFNPNTLPTVSVRKKMEVLYNAMEVTLTTSTDNVVDIARAHTPTSGELNEFFNEVSNKLNVYNDDATLFFKMNIQGTWNAGASTTDSIQISFGNSNYNVITANKTSGTDADVLQFTTYLSIDKDGAIALGGSEINIRVLESSFEMDSMFITLEQWTTQQTLTPV